MKKKIELLKNLMSKQLELDSDDIDTIVKYHSKFIEVYFKKGNTPRELMLKWPHWDEKVKV